MTETESMYQETVSKISELTNKALDCQLEHAAIVNEQSEMLLCCYLAAVRDRKAYLEFGYASILDYAYARFAFGERKTRYLVALGRKIERLPKIREALISGKLGWCKASRLTGVATPENEVMWLDSALSLTLRQLERRIKDGTDSLTSELRLPLTEDLRVLWENGLEIYRRRAGAEISPVEAFELMLAEVMAEWGHYTTDTTEAPVLEPETEMETTGTEAPVEDAPHIHEPPLFPWADEANQNATVRQWENERSAETEFATSADYNEVRHLVLERDNWKCSYPDCGARAQLHVHHIHYRSRGGCDAPWNLAVVCNFHHALIHAEQISVHGRAPMALEWTPPKLMRAVLERRRNRPSIWAGELDVREWTLETHAASP